MSYATARLGDLCDIQSGGTPSRGGADFYGGDIPWVKIGDLEKANGSVIKTQECITDKGLQAIRGRLFRKGAILFAMYGSVGKTAFAGRELSTNQAILGIEVKDPRELDSRYLRWWLYANQPRFEREARGVTQKNLSAGYVRDLEVPKPDIHEQKHIAGILDKADGVRRKRREAIKLADDLLRATFLEMFGDPVTNPKRWDVETLGELIKLKSGDFLPAKNMAQDGLFPVFGGNGQNGVHDSYMFEDSKVVIGRVGAYCGAVHRTPPRSWVTDNALFVAEQDPRLLDDYLEWALRLANLNRYASQFGQPLLSGSRIYPIEVLVPSKKAQLAFSEALAQINRLSGRCKSGLVGAEDLFNSLMQRAFTGRL